ncbi:MAG: xylulose kinase, partial [Deltaproteobacteria bacterium]|nr:xylulose kinase [Deltaproteobacteria bacterium]
EAGTAGRPGLGRPEAAHGGRRQDRQGAPDSGGPKRSEAGTAGRPGLGRPEAAHGARRQERQGAPDSGGPRRPMAA